MPLTQSQRATLKTDIAANANTVLNSAGQLVAINQVSPNDGTGANNIAAWYNQATSPVFSVLRTDVPINDILNTVTWANYTPLAPPDGTVQWSNWSLACQGKQFNLEIMLQGRTTFDASRVNLRSGLNDATTNLPSGALGALLSGGWSNILPVLQRIALNVEKLFSTQATGIGVNGGLALGTAAVAGTPGNPGLMGYEGTIDGPTVTLALNGQ